MSTAADRILGALIAEGRLEIATIPARFEIGEAYATATVRRLRRDYGLATANSGPDGKVTVGRMWLVRPSPAGWKRVVEQPKEKEPKVVPGLYYVSAYGGRMSLMAARSLGSALAAALKEEGHANVEFVRRATEADVMWHKALSGV